MTPRAPALGALLLFALPACGKRGDPLPPLPRNPQPVRGIGLAQRASTLEVRYVAPRATSAGAPLPVLEAELLLAEGRGELQPVGARKKVAPGESQVETLPLPGVGVTVRVAVRAWAGRHASAPGEVATLTVAPPAPAPSGLEGRVEATGIALAWTAPPAPPATLPEPSPSPGAATLPPSPEPSPSAETAALPPLPEPSPSPGTPADQASPSPSVAPWRYLVYRRAASEPYAGALSDAPMGDTAYMDASARVGESWCYVARTVASTAPLVESDSSSEVCVTREDTFAPAPPLGLAALLREGSAELSWSASPEADLAHYRVYRSEAGAPAVRLAELPGTETRFTDPGPPPGSAYTVTAVDASGNESAPSRPAEPVEP